MTRVQWIYRFFLGIFVFSITLFVENGLQWSHANAGTEEQKIVIGVSLPTQRDTGWVRYRKAFDKLAKSTKGVRLLIQTADQDPIQQAAQVENLLSKKINVLILAPQDADATASLVAAAHKANVKVVSLDRLVVGSDVDFYASFDNEKVGELQGQYLTQHVPEGNYNILSGAPTDNNSKLFLAGAMKYILPLEKSGKIKILMNQPIDDWQPSVAQRLIENALTKNKNNVQAILAPNDNTAGGAIEALETQKLAGKVAVTGQDAEISALQRIVKGTQSMTVFKNQTQLAELAYRTAIALAQNKTPEKTTDTINGKYKIPSYFLTPITIDKANIDKELIDTGYFTKASIYTGK